MFIIYTCFFICQAILGLFFTNIQFFSKKVRHWILKIPLEAGEILPLFQRLFCLRPSEKEEKETVFSILWGKVGQNFEYLPYSYLTNWV